MQVLLLWKHPPIAILSNGDLGLFVKKVHYHNAVKQMANDLKIDIGKTPASCSGRTHASDISDDFKAEKKVMKHKATHSWDSNPTLRKRLQAFIIRHQNGPYVLRVEKNINHRVNAIDFYGNECS